MGNTKRNHVVIVRLTDEEDKIFREKSERYGSISALIRDAVAQFDDVIVRGRLEALKEMMTFYRKYQQDLSWMGGNFNQVVKRANELAIAGQLSRAYLEETIRPMSKKIQDLIQRMKDEQHTIAKKLLHGDYTNK